MIETISNVASNNIYYLTKEEIKNCFDHSLILAKKKHQKYSEERNQPCFKSIFKNFFEGKIGECVAAHELGKKCNNCKVDFTIHQISSFDADLKFFDKKMHVKSYNVDRDYEKSWTFQYSGNTNKGNKDDLFLKHDENDYVVFTTVDLKKHCGYINCIIPFKLLMENKMFQLPRKISLWRVKRCVYLEKIIEYKDVLGIKTEHLVH